MSGLNSIMNYLYVKWGEKSPCFFIKKNMAAARTISLYMGKGRTIAKYLKNRANYEMNPDKTENGKYATSFTGFTGLLAVQRALYSS